MALQRTSARSPVAVVDRIISDPQLLPAVQRLEPAILGALIERVGLEDAGELVSLCTTEQLEALFDEDLWRGDEPGEVERFDVERFALWLYAMGEAGEEHLVRRLVELPADLLTLAVHRLVLVVDFDALALEAPALGAEIEAIEKALEGCLYQELEELCLIARDPASFDLLWPALVALDRDHHDVLRGVLERCAALAADQVADQGGLYEVLSAIETLEADVGGDRDDRRAEAGHVSSPDARAFLRLARDRGGEPGERDAITAAYFRQLNRRAPRAPEGALRRVLEEQGIETGPPVLSLGDGRYRELLEALAELGERAPEIHDQRRAEIAYLANALVAGHGVDGRRLRPVEALELACRACALGLSARGGDPVEVLRATAADLLFRDAWPELAGAGELF